MKEEFQSRAVKFWNTINKDVPEEKFDLYKQLEFHKKLFNIFQVGKYYLFVFNHIDIKFDYFSEDIKQVLDYEPHEFDLNVFLESIHPDDQAYFLKFEEIAIAFLNTLSCDQIKNYKFQYDIRIKDKNGKYKQILQQLILIQYDENHNYYRSFGSHTDITHLKKEGLPTFSIFGFNGEPSYLNLQDIHSFNKPKEVFTKREKQILKAIVEGKKSVKIADELCISLHTVNAHRRNIMAKTNCKTATELAIKAFNEFWV